MNRQKTTFLFLALLALLLAACGGSAVATDVDVNNLPLQLDVQTVAAVQDHPDVVVLDVREQWEYDEGHIPGVILLPLGDIPLRLDEIPRDKQVIITCRSGNRSQQAVTFLMQQGFDNVHNMEGGFLAWQAAGLPVER